MAKIDRVQEINLDLLRPYQNNAKIHGEEQVNMIADSIKEFGFISPCLIDSDYNIIAGHGRVMAAKQIGMDKVPCLFIEGLTEAQRRAYILADNKLTELGEWDWDKVELELDALEDMNFDISLTGFEHIDPLEYSDGGGSLEYDQEPKKDEVCCPRCGLEFIP
jgi:ParB-like chromosome segregation protein Spo0J